MTTAALKRIATGTPAETPGPNTFAGMLERMKPQLAAALPRHLSADRMVRVALTCYRLNPGLAECTPKSVLAAVVQCSQLGLEPGLLGQAYLVPIKRQWKDDSGRWHSQMECQFIPGYRGLIALARRSGEVTSIDAEIVYEQDEFELALGLEPRIVHRPRLDGDRGQPRLAYAIARFREGGFQFQWMTIAQIETIRAGSKADDGFGPWSTDYDEMVRKTVVRRLCKYLPMSVEMANAVAVSDAVDDGKSAVLEGDVVNVHADTEAPSADAGFGSLVAAGSGPNGYADGYPDSRDDSDGVISGPPPRTTGRG